MARGRAGKVARGKSGNGPDTVSRSLTAQQRTAVEEREVSVVLSSGAGCGKTTVLTERYLDHLQTDDAEVGQIVALTFTERAARQMRERIRKALSLRLRGAATAEEASPWEAHLRGLESAPISTIHAFCAALLRQHALDAGLDPRFEILEDFLAINLREEALLTSLQDLLTAETPVGDDLRHLVWVYGWRATMRIVQQALFDRDPARASDWLARSPEDIAQDWQRFARDELLPRYVHYLVSASPKIARCLWLLRTTPCLGPKMAANVRWLLEQTPRLAEADDMAMMIEELAECAKVGPERAKAWPSEEIYRVIQAAFEDFRSDLPRKLEVFVETPDAPEEAARLGQRVARVAEETAQTYQQLKHENGVVDFQDLLLLARDLVRDHDEVRARLQRRYRFLLIDELQDTDPVQMELLEHLAGAGLTLGKVFAVGDHAQSIYRFRGADVKLFQELKRRMPHEGRLGLTRNFRSQPAILHFVNALFGAGTAPDGRPVPSSLEDYEPLEASHGQLSPGPCVEFLWPPCADSASVGETRRLEADWIARRIKAMVEGGETLVAQRAGGVERLRPVRPGDVVLLFRSMSNVALYEAALRDHGLDYYLVGGRAFFAQQEIYDLLHLLRALENPQDALSLAGTLRSPFCCLSDEALFVLGRHEHGLWAGLHDAACHERLPPEQQPRAARARLNLDRWRGLKDRLPIARLVGAILADSSYDAALQFEFLGDRKLANLWKLVDMARSFDRTGLFGLAEFIRRLDDLVRTEPREEQAATQPENADVVRLMTIHQAKGLEFPVVIVPDIAARTGGNRFGLVQWHERLGCVARPPVEDPPLITDYAWRLVEAADAVEEWREELRTFYVACTRAADYLILSAALPNNFAPRNTWTLLLAERFDPRSGKYLLSNPSVLGEPRVRVTDGSCPPLVPDRRADEMPDEPETPSMTLIDPNVARRPAGARTMTCAEIESLLTKRPLSASGPQWEAEDGSDRRQWLLPAERLVPRSGDSAAMRARRRAWEHWDFQESTIAPCIEQALDSQSGQDVDALHDELSAWLTRFCRTELCRELRSAEVLRNVEFLLMLTMENAAPPLIVQGSIDILWQDQNGHWNVLCHDLRADDEPPGPPPRLVLGTLAIHHQLGECPRTAWWYDGRSDKLSSCAGDSVRWRELANAMATTVGEVRQRPA